MWAKDRSISGPIVMLTATTLTVPLAPRVRVMTAFFRRVTLPAVKDEIRRSGSSPLSVRLHRALADGGRWLPVDERAHLNAWIDARPYLRTICHLRAQLAALMESRNADHAAEALTAWVSAAQASGIDSLQRFALSLSEGMITQRAPLRGQIE